MVCRCLMQKDYQGALAWCDSINVPLTATELRINVYEQMGDWQRAFRATELKDSLIQMDEREALEIHMVDMAHDIDHLRTEQEKAKERTIQLIVVGLMAAIIIGLLVCLLVYRHRKNLRIEGETDLHRCAPLTTAYAD